MIDWYALGQKIGAKLAAAAKAFGEALYAECALVFGRCRRCDEPLGGASPDQICEDCAADEALGVVLGGKEGGDA